MDRNIILDDNQIPKKLMKVGKKLTYKINNIVVSPAENLNGVYIFLKGQAQISCYSSDGLEKILMILEPGAVIGERSVVGYSITIYVKALEDLEVLFVKKDDILKLLETDLETTLFLFKSILNKAWNLGRQVQEMAFCNVEKRICNFIIQLAEYYGIRKQDKIIINMKISHQFISDFVCSNRVTTTRAIQKLRELKFIEKSEGRYIINDLDGLKEYMDNL